MDIYEVIRSIEASEGPHRKLDQGLALLVGYRLEIVNDADGIAHKVWYEPGSATVVRLPAFTSTVDHALKFAKMIDADEFVGGVAWGPEGFKAQIEGGPQCHAATPALAVCLAALQKYNSAGSA